MSDGSRSCSLLDRSVPVPEYCCRPRGNKKKLAVCVRVVANLWTQSANGVLQQANSIRAPDKEPTMEGL
jgi:hypothetical protein